MLNCLIRRVKYHIDFLLVFFMKQMILKSYIKSRLIIVKIKKNKNQLKLFYIKPLELYNQIPSNYY